WISLGLIRTTGPCNGSTGQCPDAVEMKPRGNNTVYLMELFNLSIESASVAELVQMRHGGKKGSGDLCERMKIASIENGSDNPDKSAYEEDNGPQVRLYKERITKSADSHGWRCLLCSV